MATFDAVDSWPLLANTTLECNFDGIVGPTHHYAGLSSGNLASTQNRNRISNPRAAALQGLEKMRALAQRGFAQAVLPPPARPDWRLLHSAGFSGTRSQQLQNVASAAPQLLSCAYSASAMWCANAATVSPAADCADGRLHLSVANLQSKLHRALEAPHTLRTLQAVFADREHFCVHAPLPATPALSDEGAANHTRLCASHADAGVELFVYGRAGIGAASNAPRRFEARQTDTASAAIARRHQLDPQRLVFARQHPQAIDHGVFHNDVIAVGNQNLLLYHALAFADEAKLLTQLRAALATIEVDLQPLRVDASRITLADAVSSYLFNSQLLTRADGRMLLLTPRECEDFPAVRSYCEELVASDAPIAEWLAFDLAQSMQNGGGPACLRLRVVLTPAQRAAMHQAVLLTPALYCSLVDWIERHYRDRLQAADLADPRFADEVEAAMTDLATILELPHLVTDE